MQAEVPVSYLNLCLHILLQPFHEILYFHVVKNKRTRSVSALTYALKLALPPQIQHKPTETTALCHTS